MSIVKVYRWEYPKQGQGPYWLSHLWRDKIDAPGSTPAEREAALHLSRMMRWHNRSNRRPNPYREMDIYMSGSLKCGFISKEQMNKWFTRLNQSAMKILGLALVVYEVDEEFVNIGERQVVFDSHQARKVK